MEAPPSPREWRPRAVRPLPSAAPLLPPPPPAADAKDGAEPDACSGGGTSLRLRWWKLEDPSPTPPLATLLTMLLKPLGSGALLLAADWGRLPCPPASAGGSAPSAYTWLR